MKTNKILSVLLFISFCFLTADAQNAADKNRGTLKKPIIDSKMSQKEAFDGLDPNCPKEIRDRQKIVKVKYYSFDKKFHQGQIIVDQDLVDDVKKVFEAALKERFPIYSVIPVSDQKFRKNNRWNDDLSMIANNTSSFNYREKTGGGSLSNHAYGRAVDINTFQNPYIKGKINLPPGAVYNPVAEGTITADSTITKLFRQFGWSWGGDWTALKDYQHFEKPLKK